MYQVVSYSNSKKLDLNTCLVSNQLKGQLIKFKSEKYKEDTEELHLFRF